MGPDARSFLSFCIPIMGMFSYGFISTQILIIPYFVTFNGIVLRNFIVIKKPEDFP